MKCADRLICCCFFLKENEIMQTIQEKQPGTVDELMMNCPAGRACGGCQSDLKAMIEYYREPSQLIPVGGFS